MNKKTGVNESTNNPETLADLRARLARSLMAEDDPVSAGLALLRSYREETDSVSEGSTDHLPASKSVN